MRLSVKKAIQEFLSENAAEGSFECLMVHQALAVSERSEVPEVSEVRQLSTTHLGMCHFAAFAALCDARAC